MLSIPSKRLKKHAQAITLGGNWMQTKSLSSSIDLKQNLDVLIEGVVIAAGAIVAVTLVVISLVVI
jgi:hypothetical protein